MTGPRDALLAISLRPRPRVFRTLLEYAKTTRMNTIIITDPLNVLWAQRYAKLVLPAHVTSHALGPSHTAIASVLRMICLTYAELAGESATERLDIIAEIHEELGDTE